MSKRPPGRPPIENPQTEIFRFRTNEPVAAEIREAIAASGKEPSDWLRRVVTNAARSETRARAKRKAARGQGEA